MFRFLAHNTTPIAKQFRDGKSGVNIHRIVGYGKKIENYDKMDEKHGEIEAIEEQLIDIIAA